MRGNGVVLALLGAALAWQGPVALAQTQRSGGGDAQRVAQQLQQIASERSAAQAEAAKAKDAVASLTKQVATLTAERDALKGRLTAALATTDSRDRSTSAELEQSKARLAELIEKFRETTATLHTVEVGRARTAQDLASLQRDYRTCAEQNVEVGALAREALDRYAGTGSFARAARAEPFTGIARVRVQNFVDEYRARLDELKVREGSSARPTVDAEVTPDSMVQH
jgi:chromosome segregation ATPase